MTDPLDVVKQRWYQAKSLYGDSEQEDRFPLFTPRKELGPTASSEAEETILEDTKTLLLEGTDIPPTPGSHRPLRLGDKWDRERRKKT